MQTTVHLGDAEITRIGLGTNRLTLSGDGVAFIREAVSAGIGLIDTAHLYSGGESESTIGEARSDLSRDVIVATKGGFAPGEGRPATLKQQIDDSLRRLRTGVIDLYYLHRVDPETPLEESLSAIREYVDSGHIRHVGLSQVGVGQIERGREIVDIAAVQNKYSLSDRAYDEVVDYTSREGILFVPFKPLQVEATQALTDVARSRDRTPSQIALAWLLRRSPNVVPIPGTRSLAHLQENLGALEIELSDHEFGALTEGR
jgi:aryl-alcohol dehydrogenase-like predicted oxidoreductase